MPGLRHWRKLPHVRRRRPKRWHFHHVPRLAQFDCGTPSHRLSEEYCCAELLRDYRDLSRKVIGILGAAFKSESDDARSSLSYKLRKILLLECRRVLCTDPYVNDPELTPLAEVLDQADLLLVGTPHDCYRGLTCRQPLLDVTATITGQRS